MRAVPRGLGLSLAAALVLPSLARAQALSEADAVARALAQAPAIRASRAAARQVAAEERVRRTVTNPSARWQQEDAAGIRDRFLTLEQELPVNGRRGLLARGAASAIVAANERTAAETLAVRHQARSAYAALVGSQAREQVLTDGLASLETVTARLRAREQAGEGSTFDRLRAEREHADHADDRRAASAALQAARARLAAVLGIADGGASLAGSDSLDALPAIPDVATALQQASSRRPELRELDAEITRLQFEQQAASRLSWPQPIVSGGWKQTDDGARADSGYAFSVGVAVPIFARGTAERAVAASALAAVQARRDRVVRDIEANVRAAHVRASSARERGAKYQQDALASSVELTRIATLAYDEGEIGILELLDALRTRLAAELRALDLRIEARLAAIALDDAMAEEVIR